MPVRGEHNINVKEIDKLKKCTDIWFEVIRMWNIRGTTVSVIMGTLVSKSPNLKSYVEKIRIKPNIPSL